MFGVHHPKTIGINGGEMVGDKDGGLSGVAGLVDELGWPEKWDDPHHNQAVKADSFAKKY